MKISVYGIIFQRDVQHIIIHHILHNKKMHDFSHKK